MKKRIKVSSSDAFPNKISNAFKVTLLIILLGFIALIPIQRFLSMSSQRPHDTQMCLRILRSNIAKYKEHNGEFPKTLKILSDHINHNDDIDYSGKSLIWREYISTKDGNPTEHSVLNGKGGIYYDCISGEVKINLDKPVKEYIFLYLAENRNEIPSSW